MANVYLLSVKNNDVSLAEVVYVNKVTEMAQSVDVMIICIIITTLSLCVSHVLGRCKLSAAWNGFSDYSVNRLQFCVLRCEMNVAPEHRFNFSFPYFLPFLSVPRYKAVDLLLYSFITRAFKHHTIRGWLSEIRSITKPGFVICTTIVSSN